jgi:hypothetical protein
MKTELQEKLFSKYPKIFGDRTKPMTETCMCWGLEVGDGWYDLIDTLCEALTYTYRTSVQVDEEDGKRLGIEPYVYPKDGETSYYFTVEPPQVIATQVKEKYGTLRFYYRFELDEKIIYLLETKKYPDLQRIIDRYSDYINGIVHFAETASGRTCEATGQSGELHSSGGTRSGWLKTLNKEFAKTNVTTQGYVPFSEISKDEEPA